MVAFENLTSYVIAIIKTTKTYKKEIIKHA